MSYRSSVWEVHCSRDGSRGLLQTTFASQVDHVRRLFSVCPWCCRAAILGLLVFFLELCIFPWFFSFESLSCQLCPSHQPYLCSFTFFLCTALFCVGFSSSCHQVSRFLRSLSWGCTNIAVCMLDLGSQTAEPLRGGLQGQQVTLENYWHSLLKSHHFHCQITSLRGSREQKHTLNKIKEPLCISFNSDTAVRAAEDSLLGSSDHTKADRST